MTTSIRYFISPGKNPHENLAIEEELLKHVLPEECILYLWQNDRTVVIGRNQNAFRECRNEVLSGDGGLLARRPSGGGAVYHDMGNLNFSFIAGKNVYDPERQTGVILNAVNSLGIPAEKDGRNDLLSGGRKFSGNAYYNEKNGCCHHGTVMVNVDIEMMKRYLRPSAEKLKSKAVSSVSGRVLNLAEIRPSLTVPELENALLTAFAEEYGNGKPEQIFTEDLDIESLLKERKRMGSVDWVYGKITGFTASCHFTGAYGEISAEFMVDRGKISEAKVYTDSLDVDLPGKMEKELTGKEYDSPEMMQVLKKYGKTD